MSSSSTAPSLGPTSLTLSTGTHGQNQYYIQSGSELVLPPLLIVEAAIWYVSGSSVTPSREAVVIGLDLGPGTGNLFFVGQDEIFLMADSGGYACNTKGDSASLPTTDGFHEYRIEIDTSSGAITVFYDGVATLTGSAFFGGAQCFIGPRLFWGEASSSTFGTSEWAYVKHNAGATGSFLSYCTSGTSASGCRAQVSVAGTPSATLSTGFSLSATNVEGGRNGLFFFGTNGRQAKPWGNGSSFQCVVPPVSRAGLLTGTGTPGQCDGSFTRDLNALWCPTCPKSLKNPGAGAHVQAQLWYHDPLSTSNQTTSLSDAVEFCVSP